MTLVLTWVTNYGITMAADDALSEAFGGVNRVLRGATKLFCHYRCRAGLGTWGLGALPNPERGKNPVAVEFVMKQFLGEAVNVESTETLVGGLVDRLNGFPPANDVAVVDVASCVATEVGRRPVVYRIANCNDPFEYQPAIRPFSARVINQPAAFNEAAETTPIVGGYANAGFWVDRLMIGMKAAANDTDILRIPGTNLDQCTVFLGVIARTVSEVFLRVDITRSVGANMTTLAIPADGSPPQMREMN